MAVAGIVLYSTRKDTWLKIVGRLNVVDRDLIWTDGMILQHLELFQAHYSILVGFSWGVGVAIVWQLQVLTPSLDCGVIRLFRHSLSTRGALNIHQHFNE